MKIFFFLIVLVLGGATLWQYVQTEKVTPATPDAQTEAIEKTSTSKTQDVFSGAIDKAADVKNVLEKKTGAVLDLSNQGLTKAPAYIFDEVLTTELDLSHNKIDGALQGEVRHLAGLRVLNLSHNNFTGVPAEVGQLSNLQVLNLSYNKLTGLPYELGNLSKLKELDLRGNAYSKQDLEKIKQTLPASTVILID
jgi:Leucine-rich repeat (LRR) protein